MNQKGDHKNRQGHLLPHRILYILSILLKFAFPGETGPQGKRYRRQAITGGRHFPRKNGAWAGLGEAALRPYSHHLCRLAFL